MSEALHSVVMPGMPAGVTVTESGINAPAKASAASAPAFVSDVSGMSETQTAAMRYVDSTRAELARDLGNHRLAQRHREALNHALQGGQEPTWLREQSAEQRAQVQAEGARPVDADNISEFAAAYQPMDAETAQLVRSHAVLKGLPPQAADGFLQFAEKAQLPESHAKSIADRLVHHRSERGGKLALSPAEQAELAQESAHILGGQEKYQRTVERARTYLAHVGALAFVDSAEIQGSTLIHDPHVLTLLANLATAKGLK